MGKLKKLFTIFLLVFLQAFPCYGFFGNDDKEEEDQGQSFVTMPPEDKFKYFAKDPANLVDDQFNIPEFFYESVHFWFNIYTIYGSSHAVIHDKDNLGLVYSVMDYTSLSSSKLNRFTKASLQKQYTRSRVRQLRKIVKGIGKKSRPNNEEIEIIKSIRKAGIQIPHNRRKRIAFYKKLASNIRSQTGQKDMIIEGLINFAPYAKDFYPLVKEMGLPPEVLSIPFLESSFNIHAVSKVGAAGVWQFMPGTSKSFMKKTRSTDSRLSPFIATAGALHLLKQNRKILRRWDLAIAAYNSGTRHIVRAQRKFMKRNLPLEEMLQRYKHPHIGFAAKNFYSEFLALAYALPYKKELYPEAIVEEYNELSSGQKHAVYVAKCPFVPKKIYGLLKKSSPNFKDLNKHLRYQKVSYVRGTILVSDVVLTSRKYHKISYSQMAKMYPKNWHKLIRGKKCGK